MPVWELLICTEDKGGRRKKEGDIIAVRPHPWKWGIKERSQYFIVIVEGLTKIEADKLTIPLYSDGRDIFPNKNEDGFVLNAKRKYSVLSARLSVKADIDWTRIRDKKDLYQPLKDADIKLSHIDLIYNKFTKQNEWIKNADIKKESNK